MSLYKKLMKRCEPQEKVIYRYVPRTPYDELQQELFPSDIFETMFTQPSVWIDSINRDQDRMQDKINKFYISQM